LLTFIRAYYVFFLQGPDDCVNYT